MTNETFTKPVLINRFNLNFNDKLFEESFRDNYYWGSLLIHRFAIILAIILYALFAYLDVWMSPNSKEKIWFIRFGIVVPILIFTFFSTFYPLFKTINQLLFAFTSTVLGIGIVAMIGIAKEQELGHNYYFTGLLLVIMWIYTFSRLRFVLATISAWIVTTSYFFVIIFIHNILNSSPALFLNYLFFFLSSNIIGMFAVYYFEYYYRKNFIHINNIELKREKQLNERLMKIDKIKDEFLSNTSHELRTPVHGIIGISESLIDGATGKLTEETINNLQMVVASGKRLSNLINDILDFSKLKNLEIELQSKPTDIKQLFEVVISVIKSTIKRDNVLLYNEIPDSIPLIYGDENRIQQIIYNLIGNAVKFTSTGYIKVFALEKDDFIELCVEDTGIGIPEEKFEIIFKSFEQADSSIARSYGGTGIGLSITKKLIELHSGKIWLESEVDKGTKFYFTLPKSQNQRKETQKENSIEPSINPIVPVEEQVKVEDNIDLTKSLTLNEEEKNNSNIRILVVDDERINVQILTNHLSLQNYSVDTASDGIEALEKIRNMDYDLVLLDIMMPKMSGYEVCNNLRAENSLYDLPVIMLTAKNQPQDIVVGFDMGANDYLIKPFEKSELLARVRTLVSLKKSVREAIDNAKLANTDALTGLNNRRFLFEQANKEFEIAKEGNLDLSLMMIDIDHFKKFNDTYGHDCGDEVIKLVARGILKCCRELDIVGRYGGEEFSVLLPNTKLDIALTIAEKTRNYIEQKKYHSEKHGDLQCTISIGIASFNQNLVRVEDLFKDADNKLYAAKQNGRNRIEIA
ncbi:MAG: diguanylate cyclase [Leptospiraceae bacterium]|nr:diguanylate cyclase [Leptospiraceae bacterium]